MSVRKVAFSAESGVKNSKIALFKTLSALRRQNIPVFHPFSSQRAYFPSVIYFPLHSCSHAPVPGLAELADTPELRTWEKYMMEYNACRGLSEIKWTWNWKRVNIYLSNTGLLCFEFSADPWCRFGLVRVGDQDVMRERGETWARRSEGGRDDDWPGLDTRRGRVNE